MKATLTQVLCDDCSTEYHREEKPDVFYWKNRCPDCKKKQQKQQQNIPTVEMSIHRVLASDIE